MKKYKLLPVLTLILFGGFLSSVSAITVEEVKNHNTPADCWMIFENKVYDITTDIVEHDVYMDIRSWCGNDMTEDFKSKDGMGRDHKPRSYAMLQDLYLGELDGSSETVEKEEAVVEEHVESDNHEEDHFVEIEGRDMKMLTIQQIADMWEIDSSELLNRIVQKYSLTGSYSINSVLDELKAEGGFSPSIIKTIADEIRNGVQVESEVSMTSSESSEFLINIPAKESKNPYNFSIPFFGTLIVYFILKSLSKNGQKNGSKTFNKQMMKFYWNTILLISLIPSIVFGFILIFQYSLPSLMNIDFNFLWWHVEGSIIFATGTILHFIARMKQYVLPLMLLKKS